MCKKKYMYIDKKKQWPQSRHVAINHDKGKCEPSGIYDEIISNLFRKVNISCLQSDKFITGYDN